VLALADQTSPSVRLERWRKDGTLAWRRELATQGQVLSLGLRADESIALAGPDGFRVFGAEAGALLGERQVPLNGPGILAWAFAPDGVVTVYCNNLVSTPLRGQPTAIPLVPEVGHMDVARPSLDTATPAQITTAKDGGIVLGDLACADHEVYGGDRDETCMARLRRFDAQGHLLWTQQAGETGTRREWFWHESGGSQNPIGIGSFGLVRTRYQGETHIDGLTVLPSGAVVATLLGSTTGIWEIGGDGRVAWLRRESRLWQVRPTVVLALPDRRFGVETKGPRLGLFDANGKNHSWTGVPEKSAENGTAYAGATTFGKDRIALVRVLAQ
jgi:hypothetical protein